ncbi:WD40/YVTN/BNR-like repeat-containing protein [Pseudoalteromonas ardens]|uniref:Sortilin N-terminal domain-containing protein n=1 Tax=Pseudoalteromonas rubra TaxID=43658 RepID=A0A0L0EXQ4_9GAMM|nr:sialidase family protein [Pseudoalteromonas sp. R96]KNC69184.1 hypothetical protein AC626_00100 [Pseudoalteromonas rubra]MDK1311870.1 hypothetical protein [Pseudoalteromonas sp. R96]
MSDKTKVGLFGGIALSAIAVAVLYASNKPSINDITPKIKVHEKNIREPDKSMQGLIRVNPARQLDMHAKYDEAFRQVQAYRARESSEHQWESLGPERVGGRTRTLIFHPQNPDILFTAGISGGIWKSVNAGESWQPVASELPSMAIGTLIFDPDDSERLFAGSGEGVYVGRGFTNSIGFAGDGIMTSEDGGETWYQLESTNNNVNFQYVNKLRFGAQGRLYAVTNTGIWLSDDKGKRWQLALDQSDVLGGCLELAVSPLSDEQDRILASCGNFGEGGAVYLSQDSGQSWQPVIAEPNQGRTTLAFAPSDPTIVYALAAFNAQGDIPHALQGLYKSVDGGENWALVTGPQHPDIFGRYVLSNPNSLYCPDPEQSFIYGQGWFDNALTIDPTDAGVIWVGAVEVMRSEDGGQNWQQMSFYYRDADAPHVDHHGLYFHPEYDGVNETRLYNVNDGGIALTSNPFATGMSACSEESPEIDWRSLNSGYNVTQFYHGDVSEDGRQIVGGAQDNGSRVFSPDAGWQHVAQGDGGYAFFIDDERMLVSSQNGNVILRENGENRFLEKAEYESGLFIAPYVVDPNYSDRVWLGGQSLWRLDELSDGRFERASERFTEEYRRGITALVVKPGDSNTVVYAQTDGALKRLNNALSSDSTTTPQDISFSDTAYVRELHYSMHDNTDMYAVVSTFGEKHIWKSEDEGSSWRALDGEGEGAFPDLPAHTLVELREDPDTLFVGTDYGVYHTDDGGDSWQPFIHGLPNVAVYRMVLRRIEHVNYLYAFTYGRGVYRIALDVANQAPQWRQQPDALSVKPGDAISMELIELVVDHNGDNYFFTAPELPEGFELTNWGKLTGQFASAGEYAINIEVSDGQLSQQLTLQFEVEISDDDSSGGDSSGGDSSGGDSSGGDSSGGDSADDPDTSKPDGSSGMLVHLFGLLSGVCWLRRRSARRAASKKAPSLQ